MSWNRTVRCSVCYESGHNRRSCPQMAKRIAKIKADPNHYDWAAQREIDRRATRKASKRKCSYCVSTLPWDQAEKAEGHNRRGCVTLKADKASALVKNRAWRANFLKAIEAEGIGEGALLNVPARHPDDPDHWNHSPASLRFLVSIDPETWRQMTFELADSNAAHTRASLVRARKMEDFQRESYMTLPDLTWGETTVLSSAGEGAGVVLVSPASGSFTPPDVWVDDSSVIEEMFRK